MANQSGAKCAPSSDVKIAAKTSDELRQAAKRIMHKIAAAAEWDGDQIVYDEKSKSKYEEVIALYEELLTQTKFDHADNLLYGDACFGLGVLNLRDRNDAIGLDRCEKAIVAYVAAKAVKQCDQIIEQVYDAFSEPEDKPYLERFEAFLKKMNFEQQPEARSPSPSM